MRRRLRARGPYLHTCLRGPSFACFLIGMRVKGQREKALGDFISWGNRDRHLSTHVRRGYSSGFEGVGGVRRRRLVGLGVALHKMEKR